VRTKVRRVFRSLGALAIAFFTFPVGDGHTGTAHIRGGIVSLHRLASLAKLRLAPILQKNRDRNQEESWAKSVAAHRSPRGTERTRTSAAPRASANRFAQGHSWDRRQQ